MRFGNKDRWLLANVVPSDKEYLSAVDSDAFAALKQICELPRSGFRGDADGSQLIAEHKQTQDRGRDYGRQDSICTVMLYKPGHGKQRSRYSADH